MWGFRQKNEGSKEGTPMTEPTRPALDEDGTAYGALLILDYLQELFLASGRETFSKEQVLIALNLVKTDPEIIAPEAVIAYELATEEVQNG